MNRSEFDYSLPRNLIAQTPPVARDGGRLMVVDRSTGAIDHRQVRELPDLLPAPSLLVTNDSRVFPARVHARRHSGGQVELLLLRRLNNTDWRSILNCSKQPKEGETLSLADGHATCVLLTPLKNGRCNIRFSHSNVPERYGQIPLPPYIDRRPTDEDVTRYQTIFARDEGSIAAPTAGLHLSEELISRMKTRGIRQSSITLHVGPGTFTPVRCDRVSDHEMEREFFHVSETTANAIANAKGNGSPIVAIGTTVVRALESSGGNAKSGDTDLFIFPGFRFASVDMLVTNFHLPQSTLLMLVCAFGGRELILSAYRDAVRQSYRFYSYGDAMLVL